MKLPVYAKAFLPLLILFIFEPHSKDAENVGSYTQQSKANTVELNSYSFTVKKRSHFLLDGKKQNLTRGLTLIHFMTPTTFEFKTFDTHGEKGKMAELAALLGKMKNDKALFALLAHDSAVKDSFSNKTELLELNLPKLAELKNRQAYIYHNIKKGSQEMVNDSMLTVVVELPKSLNDDTVYFPKKTYDFKVTADRFIAHAGGEVDGHASTNTKEALDQNYAKGFRIFELDIIKTSDGHLVAAHDWRMWSRFTDYSGTLPPTLKAFKSETIYGDYHLLDMEGINTWFAEHPDAILVTDKIDEPLLFAEQFVDKDRLIMELFSEWSIEEASQNGINAMISQRPLLKLQMEPLQYLKINNIKYAAVSRRIIQRKKELMKQLQKAGVKVYVYNVNFDEGKDEQYVLDNEIGLVYGMYADKWILE